MIETIDSQSEGITRLTLSDVFAFLVVLNDKVIQLRFVSIISHNALITPQYRVVKFYKKLTA